MFKFLFAAAVLFAPSAYAGCSSGPDEDGPVAEICVGDKCERSRLSAVCSNASSAHFVYENGVSFVLYGPEAEGGESSHAYVGDTERADIQCRPVDEGSCPPKP
jgi:hypothetical protein